MYIWIFCECSGLIFVILGLIYLYFLIFTNFLYFSVSIFDKNFSCMYLPVHRALFFESNLFKLMINWVFSILLYIFFNLYFSSTVFATGEEVDPLMPNWVEDIIQANNRQIIKVKNEILLVSEIESEFLDSMIQEAKIKSMQAECSPIDSVNVSNKSDNDNTSYFSFTLINFLIMLTIFLVDFLKVQKK